MIQHIDVHAVLQQSVSGFYADLVTRPTGRAVRESIETALEQAGETVIALMDFSGVGCIDYSCADEIVAKLLRGSARVVLLRGISDGHREAIEPVLQGHGLAAVCERADGTLDAIGPRDAAAALLEELVALRVARRTSAGTFALSAA